MPTYVWICTKCQHKVERRTEFLESTHIEMCPKKGCKAEMVRPFHVTPFLIR